MYNSADVAARVKAMVKQRGTTSKQMLEDAGLSYNFMTMMSRSMPKADSLARIADVLGCSVDYLLGRTEEPEVRR